MGNKQTTEIKEQFGNYTGPWWSNGQFISSVEFGPEIAKSALDELSRLHDSAYNKFSGDENMLEAADMWYYDHAILISGKFPKLAAIVVNYGNYAVRRATSLAKNIALGFRTAGPAGVIFALVGTTVKNIIDLQNKIDMKESKKKNKYIERLEQYYRTDPNTDNLKLYKLAINEPTETVAPVSQQPLQQPIIDVEQQPLIDANQSMVLDIQPYETVVEAAPTNSFKPTTIQKGNPQFQEMSTILKNVLKHVPTPNNTKTKKTNLKKNKNITKIHITNDKIMPKIEENKPLLRSNWSEKVLHDYICSFEHWEKSPEPERLNAIGRSYVKYGPFRDKRKKQKNKYQRGAVDKQ